MSTSKAELRVRLSADAAELTRGVDAGVAHVQRRMTQAAGATRALAAGETQVQGALAATAAAQATATDGATRLYNARGHAARLAADEIILSEKQILQQTLESRRLLAAEGWMRGWNGPGVTSISPGTQRMIAAGRPGGEGHAGGGAVFGGLGRELLLGFGLMEGKKWLDEFVQSAHDVEEASTRVGVSVREWQLLAGAAKLAGAEAGEVERGIRFLQKRITESTPDAKRAFDGLGLSITALQELRPEEQFDAVARKIAAIEDPTRRAAMAMEAFGRGGTALIPMIEALDELKSRVPVIDEDAIERASKIVELKTYWGQKMQWLAGQTIVGMGVLGEMAGALSMGMDPTEFLIENETQKRVEREDAVAAQKERQKEEVKAAARAAAEKRKIQGESFLAEMALRNRVSILSGNGPDTSAQRAMALGLTRVEEMGGGNAAKGLELLEAEERGARKVQEEEKRLQDKAAKEAESKEKRRLELSEQVRERIEDLAVGETERKKQELDRQLQDYEQAGVDKLALAKLQEEGVAAIEKEAQKKAADEQEKASRKATAAAEKAARAAEKAARETAAAARKAFGFDVPEDFDAMQARGPRESARQRQLRRLDESIKMKMDKLAMGKMVTFSPMEKRRLQAARDAGIEADHKLPQAPVEEETEAPSPAAAPAESGKTGGEREPAPPSVELPPAMAGEKASSEDAAWSAWLDSLWSNVRGPEAAAETPPPAPREKPPAAPETSPVFLARPVRRPSRPPAPESALVSHMEEHRIGLGRAGAFGDGAGVAGAASVAVAAAAHGAPAAAGPDAIVAELRGLRQEVAALTEEVREGGLS